MNIRLPGLLTLTLLVHTVANAQIPTAGSPTGINAAFVKLFGDVSAFSARLDTQVFDSSDKEWVRLPLDFAALENKIPLETNTRTDIDLEQTVSRDLPASLITGLKNAGMQKIISIFRPDQKMTLILYPGAKKNITMALAEGETDAKHKGLRA